MTDVTRRTLMLSGARATDAAFIWTRSLRRAARGCALLLTTAIATAAAANDPSALPPSPTESGAKASALQEPAAVKLFTLDCGRVEMDDMDFLADDGSMQGVAGQSVVPCFVIRHPSGDLIWDTGLSDAMVGAPSLSSAAFRFHRAQTLGDQLAQIGLAPAEIEYVSFSHLHFDHAGNANLFADATWIVDRRELEVAFSEQAAQRGESKHYSRLQSARKIVIEHDSHDVFGDGTVVIHHAPGHTPGHALLLVRTRGSGAVLLTGDLWISAASQARRLVPRYNASKQDTLRSMDQAEALARTSGARIIRQHVIADFDRLPRFPAALE